MIPCARSAIDPAPGDDRVDQAIAAAAGDVRLGEAEGEEVPHVVGKPEIGCHVGAGGRARLRRVGLEADGLLGCEKLPGPRISRARAVCSGGTK
jgi:hypothetical protein